MERLKKVIENELKKLEADERNLFRITSLTTFDKLITSVEKRMNNFEKNILETIGQENEDIHIGSLMIPKKDLYLYEVNYEPILKEDKDSINIKEVLSTKEEKMLKKVFINMAEKTLKDIDGKILEGKIIGNDAEYPIKIKLETDKKYLEKMKKLYDVFCLNNIKWKTYNIPYLRKIFKVLAVEYDTEIIEKLTGEETVIITDNELKKYLVEDYILLWNVKEETSMSDGVIKPTANKIHFEHTVVFDDVKRIYLCPDEETEIYLVAKTKENTIKIITNEARQVKWKFWTIPYLEEKNYSKLEYPYFDNKMNDHFINQLKMENDIRLRNKNEIRRILNSYKDVKKYFKFLDVIISDEEIKCQDTYEINEFIVDEFKLKGRNSKMYFIFTPLIKDSFTEDILSFIVSDMQLYFPEYECIGVYNER